MDNAEINEFVEIVARGIIEHPGRVGSYYWDSLEKVRPETVVRKINRELKRKKSKLRLKITSYGDGLYRPDRLGGAFRRSIAVAVVLGKISLHDFRMYHWDIGLGFGVPGKAPIPGSP